MAGGGSAARTRWSEDPCLGVLCGEIRLGLSLAQRSNL